MHRTPRAALHEHRSGRTPQPARQHACVRGVTTPRAAGLLASYEDLAAPAQAALLADALPSMPAAWRAAVAAQTAAGAQAPASFGAVVACARFHGPRAALVGDAAHAVTSTLGQVRPEP